MGNTLSAMTDGLVVLVLLKTENNFFVSVTNDSHGLLQCIKS